MITGNPPIVVLGRGGAEHQVFGPISGDPACGSAGLNTDTPGTITVIGDLLGQGKQVIPGFGDLISSCIPGLLGIPDQTLARVAVHDTGFDSVYRVEFAPASIVLL